MALPLCYYLAGLPKAVSAASEACGALLPDSQARQMSVDAAAANGSSSRQRRRAGRGGDTILRDYAFVEILLKKRVY